MGTAESVSSHRELDIVSDEQNKDVYDRVDKAFRSGADVGLNVMGVKKGKRKLPPEIHVEPQSELLD